MSVTTFHHVSYGRIEATVLVFYYRRWFGSTTDSCRFFFFFLNDPPPTDIYPLPLPDALPISAGAPPQRRDPAPPPPPAIQREAPGAPADLGPQGPVQPRGEAVERILHEGPVDRGAAAVAQVDPQSQPEIGSDAAALRHHVLEVEVAGHIAPGDAAQLDGVVLRRVDNHAPQSVFEPTPRLSAELAPEVREPEQHAQPRRHEAVVQPHAASRGAPDLVAAERAQVELDGAGPEVVGGELLEHRLGG